MQRNKQKCAEPPPSLPSLRSLLSSSLLPPRAQPHASSAAPPWPRQLPPRPPGPAQYPRSVLHTDAHRIAHA
eukprot:2273094-Rhodomonas_salina.3